MSSAEAVGLAAVAAIVCGFAGLAVPVAIARLPEPMGSVADRPRILLRAVLGCAVVAAVVAPSVGVHAALLVVLPLIPQGVLLAIVDRHTHLLPSRVIWPMLGLASGTVLLAGVVAGDGVAVVRAAIGGAATFAFFHVLWWVRPQGLGYGDVRLSAVVGTALGFLGTAELLIGVYAGFVVFVLAALGRAAVRRDRSLLREPSPYGPAMLGGALLGLVVGSYLASR
ncbi:prepilin peptidase [Nocardioides mangrovi]|uniref:Prepilin peptidase n=1 Tax=Nocardioides mangrovi TaxID=2874580 RepID=A0ABS7UJS0_9ACTN|nr:prepilin peptidase [Nocardioides mangrovi]MBZ5741278.1 prepilin peptidase [Nocardioides mangrovi]